MVQEQSVMAHGASGQAAGASSFGMSGVNAHGIFTGVQHLQQILHALLHTTGDRTCLLIESTPN